MIPNILSSSVDKAKSAVSSLFPVQHRDDYDQGPHGKVIMELHDGETGECLERREKTNVITKDFSILLARLCKNSLDPNHGVFALAVGTGESNWDLQNPPAPTNTQRSLYNEVERKTFSDITYRDDGGSASSVPTDTVDFTTKFAQSEANDALVEMGLLGGDVNNDMTVTNPITPANGPYDETVDVRGKDILCNYLTFPVINKPSSATFSVTWRIQF